MRIIKFRGKEYETGAWRYGLPMTINHEYGIVVLVEEGISVTRERFRIHLNTLGQFTGYLDSEGREIYEGDVVQHKISERQQSLCAVEFLEEAGAWSLVGGWRDIPFNNWSCIEGDLLPRLTILGNKYDNPELTY